MPRRPGPGVPGRAGGQTDVIQQQPESSPGASSRPCARDAPSRGEEPPSSNLSASTVSAEKWHTTESPPVVFRQAQLR